MMQEKKILNLKFTKRVLRMMISISLFTILFILLKNKYMVLVIYLIPFLIVLVNLFNLPLEKYIANHYVKKAKQIIEKNNCLKIGITGSFGKTSTKFYISQMLSDKYYVHASPKSYNTLLGITKDINENINDSIEIYVLEMGATKPQDIKKINELVNINIGIITSIGTQHLESFKNIDNIIKTKLEIIESNNIELLFINSDIKELHEYDFPKDLKVVRVGTNNNADYRISNIVENFNELKFVINNQHIYTNLLGKHNALNIAFCYALCKHLGMNDKDIINLIQEIKPMEHRLKLKKYKSFQVIDDSFNSNYNGFINALESLSKTKTYNILITPGLVDQNSMLESYYKDIALKSKEIVDEIYLVNNKDVMMFKKCLDEIDYRNYIMVETLKEALNLISSKKIKRYYTILIENDLTDYYFNRG